MLGLRTTIYRVPNLELAKEWYSKAFKTKPYFENEFYIGFNIKGYELGLEKEESSMEKTDNVLSYWGVENLEKTLNSFIEAGATLKDKPMNVGGEIELASVKDPWNNAIGLIYNPEFKLQE